MSTTNLHLGMHEGCEALKHNIDGVFVIWFLFQVIKLLENTFHILLLFILSIVI
jgi:hypothetical protein